MRLKLIEKRKNPRTHRGGGGWGSTARDTLP
uniref:Uncharacterized protein n=1 Tax=Anguilla anguilla TaxID=7936 RepID=A0A0E9VGM7_ANGAN